MFERGYRQIYAEEVLVSHPARDSIAETYKRAARVLGGRYMLKVRSGASAASLAVMLLRAVTPAVGFYAQILREPRLPRFSQRVQVVLVALGVKYVEAGELIRLMMGGAARRG